MDNKIKMSDTTHRSSRRSLQMAGGVSDVAKDGNLHSPHPVVRRTH